MAQMLQLIFTLSTLISITVSSDVFGMVGESVQLYTQNPGPEFRTIFWVFNGSENVVEYSIRYKDVIPSVHYKDRVEFNNETYSLTLKNLQKTDSGLYEARASGDKVKEFANYTLLVLDPVLTLNKDTCNMSCRSPDFSINSSCYYETCEEENLTLAGVTLSLYINGSSIICNHSNAVSWKRERESNPQPPGPWSCQPGDIFPPVCPGSTPGPPSSWEASRRHPDQMPKPPQLTSLNAKEQRLYSKLLPSH
ncbi:CD48 antigen-like [Hoplias malabaricus]|uniref:CD48 antigen-like n=1 Tax=Hoplias malabaricus TaxID=27720 RepID=UPI003461A565